MSRSGSGPGDNSSRRDRPEASTWSGAPQDAVGDDNVSHVDQGAVATRPAPGDAIRDGSEETLYRRLFEDSPAPMWVYDLATLRFLAVNEAAVAIYGYSQAEFLAMTIADIRPPDELAAFRENLAAERAEREVSGPWRHLHRNGSTVEVEISSRAVEFHGRPARLVLVSDVTRRRQLEGQLRQAQKMEAVGRLAGGVAHDFNNLLAAIRGYAELALLDAPAASPTRDHVSEILRAADRAKLLTQRLLAFARQQPEATAVVELNEIVAGLGSMLRQAVDENIVLVLDLAPQRIFVRLDAALVEQAVLNLVINARDAIEAVGRIELRTGLRDVDGADPAAAHGLAPGRYGVLSVADDGQGIEAEHLALLFEPFFTTKPANKGTGLGLSIVYSVVTQAGGLVLVDSAPGRGTRFDLLFPTSSPETTPADAAPAAAPGRAASGRETILLVDDEPAVGAFVATVLERAGYGVRLVASAEAALELVPPLAPALLVTDVLLPSRSGRDLARDLRATLPDLRVLFISGYDAERLSSQGSFEPGTAFLAKPFTSEELTRAVRSLLDSPIASL